MRALPKAHLHVHLESAVRWSTLREIGAANGVPVPDRPGGDHDGGHDGEHDDGHGGGHDGGHARGGPAFTDFADFFARNALVRACLRTAEDFRRVAREFCADQAADGVRYVEVSFTAAAHGERLGDPDLPLAAVLAGLAEGRAETGMEYRVILDHSRRRPVNRAWSTLDLAGRYAGAGVVAVGLAGDEAYPVDPFVAVFAAARDRGLRVVHHAGEAAGPESIRRALDPGLAERIGHGIRAVDDPRLLAELAERRVPLEVCPASNVALGFAPTPAAHPLPRLLDAGLVVTLNTDIPAMVGVTLTDEYARLRTGYGCSDAEIAAIARAAAAASFAPAAVRRHLDAEIGRWLAGQPVFDGGPGKSSRRATRAVLRLAAARRPAPRRRRTDAGTPPVGHRSATAGTSPSADPASRSADGPPASAVRRTDAGRSDSLRLFAVAAHPPLSDPDRPPFGGSR
ncbi:adenosine deaminase [Plantactinospora sp. KBS50]|nr:adenosine deaminase [Plantactinospora sp. KBS50]